MTPKERAIAALSGGVPDVVPHFELEMQLGPEYFGYDFASKQEWQAGPSRSKEFLARDAKLFVEIADAFDYCAILYSHVVRPTDDDYVEGIRLLRERDRGRRLLLTHGDTTMAIPSGEDMVDEAIRLFENAADVKADQERKVDEALVRAEKLMRAGIDGFALCSDYCFNSGPFLSPAMFAEFVAPYLTRLIKGYRDMGAYVIKHTDGDIMPIIDQLVAARPHGLHSLDPMAGVDIAEVKRRYGSDVCLIGNVNCATMQTDTDEAVLESCRYAMEGGKPGGGFIFSTSNCIFKGMPRRSYDIMLDYYRSHRVY
jgi:uroporphyrinogen decarboxylase